jgi:ABC-type transport system involved in cytochrome c biogenesis permease subunit
LAELLFWPALVAYGEAALALVGETRRPGLAGRLAIWGVRLGWLAQTALLGVQAARADGFPWSSGPGALNLLAWLVVGAYLIWGCRPRFRLLGLAVMPLAAALLVLAYAGGGIEAEGGHPGVLLAFHVAAMLAAFAGFAVAAGLSALFLWHERRLKRREARILRLRVPPLDALERLSARTIAVSLATLSAGIVLGIVSYASRGASFDAAMAATLVAWALYAAFLLLRREAGLHGRRAAHLSMAGFALVLLILPVTHFAA